MSVTRPRFLIGGLTPRALKFDLRQDAVKLYNTNQREKELDAEIVKAGRFTPIFWKKLGKLNEIVTERIELETKLRPWL